jgi:hypothetical protein
MESMILADQAKVATEPVFTLEGKTALGAGRGIGKAIARRLAAARVQSGDRDAVIGGDTSPHPVSQGIATQRLILDPVEVHDSGVRRRRGIGEQRRTRSFPPARFDSCMRA